MEEFVQNEEYNIELAAIKRKEPTKQEGHLTVDVFQTNDDLVIQATISGVKSKDLDIAVTKDLVTIKGTRLPVEKIRSHEYIHQELYWGPFSRAIILPFDIDADNAKASLKDGLLTIRLPKLEKNKSRRLSIIE